MKPIRKDPAGYKTTELHNAHILAGIINDFAELFLRDFFRRHPRELSVVIKKQAVFMTVPKEEFDAIDSIEQVMDTRAAPPAAATITAASIAHGAAWADKGILHATISASGQYANGKALYLPNDPKMVEMAKDAMVGEIKNLTGYYATGLKRELRTAWEKGETMPQITKRIQEVTGLAKNKAVTIARTETLRAGNAASIDRYKRVEIERVEWVSALDDRICEECESLHGETFDIDNIPDLPVHPNCRCTVVPLITVEE